MSSSVVQSTNFNTSHITFSPPKSLDSGAKTAYLNYEGRNLITQTASMELPYGISKFDKAAGPAKYSVALSFKGHDEPGATNKKMSSFYKMVSALDEFMIDQGVKNSQAWFREKLDREVVKRFYSSMIHVAKDAVTGAAKPYPPTLKVNLKQRRDSEGFDVQVYDSNKQPYLDAPVGDLLVKGARVTCLIQCTGVWFAGTSKYGLSWKLVQVRTDSVPKSINGCGFADDDEEESAPAPAPAKRVAPAPAPAPALEDDEEEEEVDDDEVFSAPAPAPAPARKSVLAAVTAPAPAPAPAPVDDDDADDVEPVAVPKKKIVTTKKVVGKKA